MKDVRAVVLLLVGMTLVLSGCSGAKGAPPAGVDPSSTVNATGQPVPDAATLKVTVVDDSVAPIAGAQVGITELQVVGRTDAAGSVTIGNLPPDEYYVVAQALGFASTGKRVELGPNEEKTLTITLPSAPVEGEPRVLVKGPFEGYFTCSVAAALSTGSCLPVDATGDDKIDYTFKLDKGSNVSHIVGEMKWSQGSAATSTALALFFSYQGASGFHWWCLGQGASPIKWVYSFEDGCLEPEYCGIGSSQEASEAPTTSQTLLLQGTTPFTCEDPSQPHLAELAFQQKFTIYVTLFENTVPDENYTAFGDT